MGRSRRARERDVNKAQTLPPSPSHSFSSSSSSDFEFTITSSAQKTSIPADELFYKGQLLPLHLSPRLSLVRTLLLSSPSTSSSSDTTTTASRDSTGSNSSNDSNSSFASDLVLLNNEFDNNEDSARPSSVTDHEDEVFKQVQVKKPSSSKYLSLSRFSSVFKGKNKEHAEKNIAVKKVSTTKEVIRKYLKKVKPLYDKFSQKQKPEVGFKAMTENSVTITKKSSNGAFSNSFSGNLKYPRRRRCVSSCPSSMRSSPNHSYNALPSNSLVSAKNLGSTTQCSDFSSMEELQSAIQGAIAHCKNSMVVWCAVNSGPLIPGVGVYCMAEVLNPTAHITCARYSSRTEDQLLFYI